MSGGLGGGSGQTGDFGSIGPFAAQSTQTVGGQPELSVTANKTVTITPVSAASSTGTLVLATAATQGVALASDLFSLGPERVAFSPPLILAFHYSTATLAALGIPEENLFLYEFVPSSGLVLVPNQVRDTQNKEITVPIGFLSSLFGLFGKPLDVTPPVTRLTFTGGVQFTDSGGNTFASSATAFVFSAVDPVVNGAASGVAFTQYRVDAATPSAPFQVFATPFRLPEGRHVIEFRSQDRAGNLEVVKSSAVAVDATPPVTAVSIGSPTFTAADGTIYIATATPVAFSAADPPLPTGQPGSGVNHIEAAIDGGAFAAYAASLTFAEGRHTVLFRSIDNVGNVEGTRSLALQSDGTPPVSSLYIGQPQFALSTTAVLVSARTPFSISAFDPVVNNVASGVQQTQFRINGSSYAVLSGTFTLAPPDGPQTINFFSIDNVNNAEVIKSSAVLLDSTPPELAFLSPASVSTGICRVFKGKFPVLGTARDLHFQSYVLEFAPGQDATSGFVLLSSGAAAVASGTLGVWNTSALSGWQTLRLTASDLVQNVSVLTINVFIGDPALLMVLGNHDVFDMPTGVAVSSSGAIYVADRNDDRIAVFSATGTLLASFGAHKDRDDDDGVVSTASLRLNKPSGVALDAAGDVFVADTNDNRVVELSPAGQVLLEIGRRKPEKDGKERFMPGKGPGEFNKPFAVAVGPAGAVYVSDTENRRVQVFSSTGAFVLQFALPSPSSDKDDDGPGKPFGIAVDAVGNIYVADPKGHRALKFDPAGAPLLTLPISGRPQGIAVSPSGDCILVSDFQLARVQKFDALGDLLLTFGSKATFRKPAGLALDPNGALYVADRNADRIEKFGLPDGSPVLVVPAPKPGDDGRALDIVAKEDGGTVERKDKAAVTVPADALADDLKISVASPLAGDEAQRSARLESKSLLTASLPVEYRPEGTTFNVPVTLTLPYDPGLVARQNGSEKDLKVHYWNPNTRDWEVLDSQVDPANHVVIAKTTHFSLYQVLGAGGAPAAGPSADPTFVFHDLYAFPNPSRRSQNPTIRLQVGLADSVDVHIYDVSGQLVHGASLNGPQILDDGNGKGFQYTYDYPWDTGHVGSGVYIYVVTAHKSGQADISRTKKAAVIK